MIKEFPRARYTLVRYIDIRYEHDQIATMDNGSSARSVELLWVREILTYTHIGDMDLGIKLYLFILLHQQDSAQFFS